MTGATGSKVAVITGAGSGIGRAVARAFLEAGHRVAACGRRPEPLAETVGDHAGGLVVPMDVTDPVAVTAGFDRIRAEFGRVDVLFNNAGGFGPGGAVDEISLADWNACLAVNLTGTMLCAAAAVSIMKQQQPSGGKIINNGSISAHTPRPRSAAYAASKHAITGLTKSIELDGRPYKISCGQIDIGNAATAMTGRMSQGTLQADGELRPEPTFDVAEVGRAVLLMAELPLEATINSLVITAAGMPFVGRG
ncbi:SDR family oxidoreductase [Microlunatus speluncae]|uniref:SDR family oxidoreductase n=1 Tax=Microlunatus speluncae TaxID=2594267 RepID=UPI0012666416|nr:SDR family oxidoreductase [Microlunatus speluncae]